jgi:hypothetical protein
MHLGLLLVQIQCKTDGWCGTRNPGDWKLVPSRRRRFVAQELRLRREFHVCVVKVHKIVLTISHYISYN